MHLPLRESTSGCRARRFFAEASYFPFQLVGGLQGAYGENENVGATTSWVIKNNRESPLSVRARRRAVLNSSRRVFSATVTNAVITFSYLFVCSFAISWGPVSWTYPSEIFPLRVVRPVQSVSRSAHALVADFPLLPFNSEPKLFLSLQAPTGSSTSLWRTPFLPLLRT